MSREINKKPGGLVGDEIISVLDRKGITYESNVSEVSSLYNERINGFSTTVTAAEITNLTESSTYNQEFTGSTTQTIQMPSVSTLTLGRDFKIINNSTGVLTVNSSGSDLITTVAAGITVIITCVKITGTDETSWDVADFGGAIIYEPTTEPTIVTGTPNELTLNLSNSKQSIFEPRLSTGTQAININFDLLIINDSISLLFSAFFRLTGTRIITLESDVKVSVPSTLGSWAAPDLTITAGTDDDILFVFQKNKTGNFWDLSVNEKSV